MFVVGLKVQPAVALPEIALDALLGSFGLFSSSGNHSYVSYSLPPDKI